MDDVPSRSIVLGFDGLPWSLVERWANAGELPTFATMMDAGASGPLESTMPPTTAAAWPAIATGTEPDAHGIYAFHRLTSAHDMAVNTSEDRRTPALWDMLSPAHVGNVPMTYPPQAIDGSMVAGMMSPSTRSSFTHPPSLGKRIAEEIPDYDVGLQWSTYDGNEAAFETDLSALVEARRELLRMFLAEEDWRLVFYVFTAPDRLQHLIWDEDVILEHYRVLDDILAEVWERAREQDANLFVLSDHGFGPLSSYIHLNTVFEEAGLLRRRTSSGSRGMFERLGLTKDRAQGLLQRYDLEETVVRLVPDAVLSSVASRVPGTHGLYDVDLSATKAVCFGTGLIYINDEDRFEAGIVPSSEREAVKDEVRAAIEAFADSPASPAGIEVYDGDELYARDPNSPDLVAYAAEPAEIDTALAATPVTDSGAKSGAHRRTGMMLAVGPHIESTSVSEASVVDIAPTVLHSQLEPIPATPDGRVLDIFAAETPPAIRRPTTDTYDEQSAHRPGADDFDEVEDRLRGLGYIE